MNTACAKKRLEIQKSQRPSRWQLRITVHGLKKDLDRFNGDLPHILDDATRAYGLSDKKVRRKK